ncbi:MAG: hypothetical protein JWQ40_2420 [Segetibacter sp.]|nr:hypothetical protein [Segetibacter sp.]
MSDKTVSQLIGENSLAPLKEHLSLYALDHIGQSLGDMVVNKKGEISLGDNFLNASATINCTLFQSTEGEFLFLLKAIPEQKQFAEFFPQMLPYNPWGVTNPDEYPFPSLQALAVKDISWQYIYFSTPDTAKQQLLWSTKATAEQPTINSLKLLSGYESSVSGEPLAWIGGMYYAGVYDMPWNVVLRQGRWDEFIPLQTTVPVKGCVYQQEAMTFLKLTVELLPKANPFGDDVVKNMALAFQFSSAFADPTESAALLSKGGERRIGLSGTIQIGDNAEVTIEGSWPLDGDEIVINANCSLHKIQDYFSGNSIDGLSLPEDMTAAISLSVSKSERTLDKIGFALQLDNWNIVHDVLSLKQVNFDVRVFSPGSLNLTMADFATKAAIGSTSLICTGQYPEGIYYLGLDPNTPVNLDALIGSITGTSGLLPADLFLSKLSGSYNGGAHLYDITATVSSDKTWNAGPPLSTQSSGVHLQNISAVLRGAPNNLFCSIKADFSIAYTNSLGLPDAMNFEVQCIYSGSWFFSASYTGDVSLADVGSAMGFGDIPALLSNCQLNALSLTYDSAGNNLSFATRSTIRIEGTSLEADLLVDKTGNEFDFSGKFIYRDNEFDFTYSKQDNKRFLLFGLNLEIAGVVIKLVATSQNEDNENGTVNDKKFSGSAQNVRISIIHAIKSLTNTDFEKPVWLPDIVITDLSCSYDSLSGSTTLSATAYAADHKVQFVFYRQKGKDNQKSKYAFALLTDDVSLAGLPVVGDVLSEVAIKNVGFVYASEEANYALPFTISGTTNDKNTADNNGAKYKQGINFLGKLHLPVVEPFMLTVLAKEPGDTSSSSVTPVPAPQKAVATPPSSFQSNTNWFDVNKKLGPVTIDRVGFQIKDGTLGLLISADIAVGPLTFSLTGLAISFNISRLFKQEFDPAFSLEGLALLFNSPPVEISGSFIKTTVGNPPRDEFNGTAIIKATDFTLSALGSYTNVNGNVSLFVYGYLEKAIGGPSFFFVEGLALGFGYNRRIVMPPVEEVAHFPLVAQVMGGDVANTNKDPAQLLRDELTSLDAYLPIEPGELFFVVGVKFNSFKLIDSFALLAVSFGKHTEIDVLGQSNIVVPISKDGKKVDKPLAEIKIFLAAKFLPDEGFLGITAQLSKDSYIFSRDCHLTGGAAFYSWFKGEHEGDFVVTMGGYHPHFTVPAHYPQVPRLALNWQITSKMSIKGDMYFALCPHAFMAGGHLEALYDDGDFKAWFKAGADFLITWQPYHYEASIYVDIGASLHIDLWFTSFTITVEFGADVEIWGPEFSGKATIHICGFDVTIRFGPSGSATLKPIEWDAFLTSSLPEPEKTLAIAVTSGEHGKDVFEKSGQKITYPIINPKELEFVAASVIPVKKFDDNVTRRLNGTANAAMLQSFGIAPMDKKNESIESSFTVSVYYNEDEPAFENVQASLPENFVVSTNVKKMPASIWGTAFRHDLNEEERVVDVVNGLRFVAKEPTLSAGINYPGLQDIIAHDNDPIAVKWQQQVKVETTANSKLQTKLGLKG